MRTQLHLTRLRRLADHLAAGNLAHDYSKARAVGTKSSNYIYFSNSPFPLEDVFLIFPYLVLELEYLFQHHFGRNSKGRVIFYQSPNTTVEWTLPWFFCLSTEEFENLFIPNKQNPYLYDSVVLDHTATPKQCAYNIYKFIEAVEHEANENVQPRTVIIEKTRDVHPDKLFKELENL